jgi:hypothetical protein
LQHLAHRQLVVDHEYATPTPLRVHLRQWGESIRIPG